jgi:hypothetical protein
MPDDQILGNQIHLYSSEEMLSIFPGRNLRVIVRNIGTKRGYIVDLSTEQAVKLRDWLNNVTTRLSVD